MRQNRTRQALAAAVTVAVAVVLAVVVPGSTRSHGMDADLEDLIDRLAAEVSSRGELVMGLLEAAQFEPPACVSGQEMFTDVPATSTFCPWIEELARRGITSGCTATQYCPGSPVNRGQMAVFVVRSMEACPTLDPTDEMVRVGGVCIDKYEASVWDAPVGGNPLETQAQIDAFCPDDGQDCKDKIFARSVAGVQPARFITWFQAQQALANSGKRLPSNAEWQMAASGTPDDTGPDSTPCNTRSGDVQNTGANADCVSDWGVFDMVGNIWEWVAEWVPLSEGCGSWGDVGEFSSDDSMCFSGASTTTTGPGALHRGGSFGGFTFAGPFAVDGLSRPSESDSRIGFRGAR